MDALKLSRVAEMLGAPMYGPDVELCGIGIDSRRLDAGELFLALSGERFDGHDFIDAARAAGAAAALTERGGDWGLSYVVVDDARRALGTLAAGLRRQLPAKLVGVTGSNGKTTVKEMLASILRQFGPTLYTDGNLNNEIGVPLTLLRLAPSHAFGVIEMGASEPGEIDYLTRLVQPDVGVVNNAGAAHLAGFGGTEGIARGKGELFAALPERSVAVINADDRYAPLWRELAGPRRVIDFGLRESAQVSADAVSGQRFRLRTPGGEAMVELSLPGAHNVMNSLAAAAAATALGASPELIAAGLAATPQVQGRLNWWPGPAGSRILDDSYNANPSSLAAGLAVLAAEPGERWLVLGDMGELGPEALALHGEAGEQARAAGASRLFAVGPLAAEAARRFGNGGSHYPDRAALISALGAELRPDVSVLVKGSRFMSMEQVVQALAVRGEG